MEGISSRWRWLRFAMSVLIFGTAFVRASYVKVAIAQSESATKANQAAGAGSDQSGSATAQGAEQPSSPSSADLSSLVADTPNMFGDFEVARAAVTITAGFGNQSETSSVPLGGGCGRLNIADNNNTIPQDRVYLLFNQFENAFTANTSFRFATSGTNETYTFSPDRFTLGFEKRSPDCLWSVEARIAAASQFDFTNEKPSSIGTSGGQLGNLDIIVKRMVYQTRTTALALGLGVDIPTGSRAEGVFFGDFFRVNNQSLHLVPFVAIASTPRPAFFYQAFLQMDVATNGNTVDSSFGPPGSLYEQTLMHLDLETGYWLYRNQCACVLTGLASVVELHYTRTMQGAHSVEDTFLGGSILFTSGPGQMDVVDLTIGLHAELARQTLLRVGASFPLTTDQNRTFDNEIQVQLERRF